MAMIPYGSANVFYFGYDPLGRCVKRWVGPAGGTEMSNPATYLYYDGWNLVQEGSSAANAGRLYVQGGRVDEIVASLTGGAWNYHHYDARGHCILLTGPSGSVIEQYEYDAFGKPYFYNTAGVALPYGSSYGNRFLFTGREWLSDLRLYDYRNRMYQPELGRFLQPDPKQFAAGDYNLYRYCHNDPVNKIDPFGLLEYAFTDTFPTSSQPHFFHVIGLLQHSDRYNQINSSDHRTVMVAPTDAKHHTGLGYLNGDHKHPYLFINPHDSRYMDATAKKAFDSHPNELPPAGAKGQAAVVGHEIGHLNEPHDEDKGGHNVQKNENPMRSGLELRLRETYFGVPVGKDKEVNQKQP